MTNNIETKVVCEICLHDVKEDLEIITINGNDYVFCADSRACALREHRRIERESEGDNGDRN